MTTVHRTSVVLDSELRSKLVILAYALGADMGDIIRDALDLYFEYTKMYAQRTNNKDLLYMLELAERAGSMNINVTKDDIKKFALGQITQEVLDLPKTPKERKRESKK